jgi:tetratricopeptide (TPR) repeat protein
MQLEISQGDQTLATIVLEPGIHSIGRSQDNDICLNDSGVSGHHAQIEVSDDFHITVVDLKSTNGTWLDNIKVVSSSWERIDAILKIGGCQIFLRETDKVVSHHTLALPYMPQKTSPPSTPSIAAFQPSFKAVADNGLSNKLKNVKEIALLVGVILLIAPFIFFLGNNVFSGSRTIQEVETAQKEKMQIQLENKKNIALSIELAKVQEFIDNKNFQNANNLLQSVLQKDPANIQANTLKEKIFENVTEQERIAKEQELERSRMEREQEKQKNLQIFSDLKVIVEKQMLHKDFPACMQTAQKMLALEPGNNEVVTILNLCSRSVAEEGKPSNEVNDEHEKKKLLSKLKEVLKNGNDAVKQKKYEAAIQIWSKAASIDHDNAFEITKEINKKAANLRADIAKRFEENINLGHAAKKKEDYIGALKYYNEAHNISPLDKEGEMLYEKQLKDNSTLAEELYNEAIAYASLGSMENAKKSIGQAKLLAKGNTKLLEIINRKVTDYNER